MPDYEVFNLGNVVLRSGATLREARLAYKTFGHLSRNRDNVIVYPTAYGGQHRANEWLIGEGKALDPREYFIVIPNMFGTAVTEAVLLAQRG